MAQNSYPPILQGLIATLGTDLVNKILSSKILLVGSGGIGCELLKNLALSGFRHVEIIDLDTIDVSNLNRQFLFRSHHVGMAKCVVASEAALGMVPPLPENFKANSNDAEGQEKIPEKASYIPHHGNVCDNTRFNVPYIQQFSLVLNALDNVTARRRVNRLCLAASVPLIEAGTAGYLGQVTVIDKESGTECYECQAKATQKVYPICTIRSTPSMPVHCIVWAKEAYKLCFGSKVEESMLYEDEESLRAEAEAEGSEKAGDEEAEKEKNGSDNGNAKNGDKLELPDVESSNGGGEKSTYMDAVIELRALLGIDSSQSTSEAPPQSNEDGNKTEDQVRIKAQEALTALFATEIEKQIGMDRYKTADKVPVPVSKEDLSHCTNCEGDEGNVAPSHRKGYKPTDVWSAKECVQELASCFVEVFQNMNKSNGQNSKNENGDNAESDASQNANSPLQEFDKDDPLSMRFVTAASNLRSYVFQIDPIQSMYSAKGIAGNIIPAIATTNAIVAGLQVLQAFHVLKSQMKQKETANTNNNAAIDGSKKSLKDTCKYIYCLRDATRKGYYLQPTTLPDPNPNCFVCRNAIISLSLNTNLWTLDMLLQRVIKKELGFQEPTILVGGDIVYEEGEDIDPSEYAVNLPKSLVNLPAGGISHGSVIRLEDFTQDLEVDVNVSHKDQWTIEVEEGGKKELKEDDREEVEKFELGGTKPTVKEEQAEGGGDVEVHSNAEIKEDNSAASIVQSDSKVEQLKTVDDDDDIEIVEVDDSLREASKESSATDVTTAATAAADDGDDSDIEIIEDATPSVNAQDNGSSKTPKKRSIEEEGGSESKKAKLDDGEKTNAIEVIEID